MLSWGVTFRKAGLVSWDSLAGHPERSEGSLRRSNVPFEPLFIEMVQTLERSFAALRMTVCLLDAPTRTSE